MLHDNQGSDPVRLARMVKEGEQLATRASTTRPHPTRLDGESGCEANVASPVNRPAFFTTATSAVGPSLACFSVLAVQSCSPPGRAAWGPVSVEQLDRIGWVLIHSLWQFALVALLAAALQWALRHRMARARYATLLAAMSLVVALPAVTWFLLPADVPVVAANSNPNSLPSPFGRGAAGEGFARVEGFPNESVASSPKRPLPNPLPEEEGTGIASSSDTVSDDAAPAAPHAWWSSVKSRVQPWLPVIVLAWLTGVALFAIRPLASWYTVRRLRTVGVSPVADVIRDMLDRTAKKLRLARAVAVLQSTLVKTPLVIGYFRPLVLLPVYIVTGLPESQLELILAHELAHIRRHDYLVNLLQTLIETLFFYHPAVWWLSRQIRHERENCCDDVAISLSANRADYGRALLAIEELRAAAPALSLAAGGGRLVARIRRVAGRESTPRAAGGIALAVFVVPVAILALVLWGSAPAAEKPKADGQLNKTYASNAKQVAAAPDETTNLTLQR